MSNSKSELRGSIAANPMLVLLLGAGPALAATTSVIGALGMGLAVLLVMVLSNLLAALLAPVVRCGKLLVYAIIGAGTASLVQMLMQAFLPGIANMLGVYIAVLAVDLVVFAGAEDAAKAGVGRSVAGSVKTALFFTVVMAAVALVRELFGSASIAGIAIPVLKNYTLPLLQEAPGAFLVYGLAAAVVSKLGCRCEGAEGIAVAAAGVGCCTDEKEA